MAGVETILAGETVELFAHSVTFIRNMLLLPELEENLKQEAKWLGVYVGVVEKIVERAREDLKRRNVPNDTKLEKALQELERMWIMTVKECKTAIRNAAETSRLTMAYKGEIIYKPLESAQRRLVLCMEAVNGALNVSSHGLVEELAKQVKQLAEQVKQLAKQVEQSTATAKAHGLSTATSGKTAVGVPLMIGWPYPTSPTASCSDPSNPPKAAAASASSSATGAAPPDKLTYLSKHEQDKCLRFAKACIEDDLLILCGQCQPEGIYHPDRQLKEVEWLLSQGVNPNVYRKGKDLTEDVAGLKTDEEKFEKMGRWDELASVLWTPLMLASRFGRTSDLITTLKEGGAKLTNLGQASVTALHVANTEEIARWLVENGMGLDIYDKVRCSAACCTAIHQQAHRYTST